MSGGIAAVLSIAAAAGPTAIMLVTVVVLWRREQPWHLRAFLYAWFLSAEGAVVLAWASALGMAGERSGVPAAGAAALNSVHALLQVPLLRHGDLSPWARGSARALFALSLASTLASLGLCWVSR